MAVATILTSFAAGEVAPSLYGRVDLQKYHVGASTARNVFVDYRGGMKSRPGGHFVGQCKQPGSAAPPRLISFGFSITQGYILEFGDHYIRFIQSGAYITETPVAISNVTNANPGVVSVTGTPFNNNDWVSLAGVGGMLEIDNRTVIVSNVGSGSFEMRDPITLNLIDTTSFGTYTSGGTAARIYEIASPWAAVDLPLLKFSQSADTMSIVHGSYPPYDLQRHAQTNWTCTPTQFGAKIKAPASCSATATVTTGSTATDFQYVVTAVDKDSGEESVASPIGDAPNSVDIAATAGSIVVQWSPVDGASSYNVYKAPPAYNSTVPLGSTFGFAGRTIGGTSFVDSNITQDESQVPPVHTNPFAVGAVIDVTVMNQGSGYAQSTTSASIVTSAGTDAIIEPVVDNNGHVVAFIIPNGGENYVPTDRIVISGAGTGAAATLVIGPYSGTFPSTIGYFQERRVYAATNNNPDTYYLSKPGAFTNFDTSIPTVDDDAITGTPWSLQVNGIQFMTGMVSGLILFTGGGCWLLSGGQLQAAITPANQVVNPEGYHGCAQLCPPIPIDYDVLFVQAKGSVVRDLQFNFWSQFYQSSEVTTLSNHLFAGHSLREWAYAAEPNKIIWAVRDDGVLLSFTFFKEQDVYAWTRHDTG